MTAFDPASWLKRAEAYGYKVSLWDGGVLIENPQPMPADDLDLWWEIHGTKEGDRKRNMRLVRLYLEKRHSPAGSVKLRWPHSRVSDKLIVAVKTQTLEPRFGGAFFLFPFHDMEVGTA